MLIKFKYILLSALILLLLSISSIGAYTKHNDIVEPNLNVIRKLLISALDSKKTTDSLYANLNAVKDRSALINGYIGTLEALKAKHAWNPYFKIKYLNDSEKTFKAAVSRDPHNIEIRFMRFSVEHNVPGFLGYNKNLYADRQEIIKQLDKKYYSSADKLLVKTIITFLINSKRCTLAESNNLKQHLAAL
ncbi:MAG: hypothetical protein JWR76_2061 [Mucilaginibacter sp.]|nr:hypothetical protein [Mucilaginibacter sp.]